MTSAAAAVIYIAGSPAVNPQIRIPMILTAVAMPQTASIFCTALLLQNHNHKGPLKDHIQNVNEHIKRICTFNDITQLFIKRQIPEQRRRIE